MKYKRTPIKTEFNVVPPVEVRVRYLQTSLQPSEELKGLFWPEQQKVMEEITRNAVAAGKDLMAQYDSEIILAGQSKTAESCSRAAYEWAEPRAGTLRRLMLDFLRRQGERGATCDEIAFSCNLTHQNASPRMTELYRGKKGKYPPMAKGTGRMRVTRGGRKAEVYIAIEREKL